MVHVCVVPGCSNRSDREKNLTYHSLPLKNSKLLKVWIHKIGRKNLPLTGNSGVCSIHFLNSTGRLLRPDEYPTINMPVLTTPTRKRKPPTSREMENDLNALNTSESVSTCTDQTLVRPPTCTEDVATQTFETVELLCELQSQIVELQNKLHCSRFRLSNMANDNQKIHFFTGFPNFATLMSFYEFLGPAVNSLNYWGSEIAGEVKSSQGRNRSLPPTEDFFLVLVRLRLGLFERDLAERFEVSVSTVCRICITWINFLYIRLKEIPSWPKRELVHAHMPQVFRDLYPTTRVIVDATEIFVETPALPEIQQMTFSSYKNHNTYKALVGISPGGVVTFVSKLFPGSISDKQLTKVSGLLQLLEEGDSVMADRGFDIQDDLTPLGVRVNIPPFLKGKPQLDDKELIETRRIASLRIHIERAMGRIKCFHILQSTIPASLTHTADQIFTVCALLTNFMPPLCS